MKTYTLCIVRKDGRILLGMKKRGFGAGRWNGFGGKVLPEESVQAAALRELREESGLSGDSPQERAIIIYSFASKPDLMLKVHVFELTTFSGNPVETEEMRPEWFVEKEIPYGRMWQSDRIWLPEILKGNSFEASFHFKDPDDDIVLHHKLIPKSS